MVHKSTTRRKRVALIGAGPTAVYLLRNLLLRSGRFDVTIYEAGVAAGCGVPYSEEHNSMDMMANITSIELPPVLKSLADWLKGADKKLLARFGIDRGEISDRDFYPRILLGAYFIDQLATLVKGGIAAGHSIAVETSTRVIEINPAGDKAWVKTTDSTRRSYDAVILATGHFDDLRDPSKSRKGIYRSPYPTHDLSLSKDRSALILGSSLSGVDAVVALATKYGRFIEDGKATRYRPSDSKPIRITMSSRKGLVPEADFFYPIPEEPLLIFTAARLKSLLIGGKKNLLGRSVRLFRAQLQADDPEFVEKLGIKRFTPQRFHAAYFEMRRESAGFKAVARDLARSRQNYLRRHTVMWRYTMMRAHEVFSEIAPFFEPDDLEQFKRYMTPVFADAYGCIPHRSVDKLLALHHAGCLEVVALEGGGEIRYGSGKFTLSGSGENKVFGTIIDARGQTASSLSQLGFGRLQELLDVEDFMRRTNGEPDDDQFRLPLRGVDKAEVFCLSIPVIMNRYPFAQGLFACSEAAEIVARSL